ncbi:MAG TPA: Na+/H+ antiporter NhaA, partial [Thermoleophilaceae bacterium]
FAIVPVFALANAGIEIDDDLLGDALSSPITLGIVFGYVLGKPLGVVAAVWVGTRRALGGLQRSLGWPSIVGTGAVGGIGFTVALLISSLAFEGQQLEEAKLGVLAAAILATLVSWAVFRVIDMLPESTRARQLVGTAEELLDLSDEVDPERDHIRGPAAAPVTLVEYGDYECPYCGRAEVVIRGLLDSFGDELRYAWRHLPLNDVHSHAQIAAEAAEAAGAQGRFWELHDRLLADQEKLTAADLTRHARELGIDVERFWDELRRREHASRVDRDVASADASGVAGTPTFFINGRRHRDAYDLATLTAAVKAAQARERHVGSMARATTG